MGRFGEAAGWAQTVLFVADLPAVRKRAAEAAKEAARGGDESGDESGEEEEEEEEEAPAAREPSPGAAARADRLARREEAVWAEAKAAAVSGKKRAASSSPDAVPTPRKAEGGKAARG